MRHARPDYNRFQDPENKIPDDEPVFLLRGQDPLASNTVRCYVAYCSRSAKLLRANGDMSGSDKLDKIAQVCNDWADRMDEYRTNLKHVHLPDL